MHMHPHKHLHPQTFTLFSHPISLQGDDMPSLRNCDIGSLDVDVSMEKIDGIPVEHCSNVFCTFAIPLQIKVARVDSKTEDIDDDGVFETAVCNENIATPMNSVQLGYNETL
eukprot:321123-Amorphochlora_amoeboformis.AAC.1